MAGFEPATSSLPRKCSTPELHGRDWSGRRGSNSRPLAWKANALPTELLPHLNFIFLCGWRWIRTTEGVSQQIYSLPHLATLVSTLFLAISMPLIFRAYQSPEFRLQNYIISQSFQNFLSFFMQFFLAILSQNLN